MNCEYFGRCGSCTLYDMNYEEQLNFKLQREKERFQEFYTKDIDIIRSEDSNFRNRAEFRIWKNFDDEENPTLTYVMAGFNKERVEIKSCSIVNKRIAELMPKLLENVKKSDILLNRFYAVEFLVSSKGDTLLTMIYHKKLDESWKEKAKELENILNIKIIGRSRGQKLILSEEFISEELEILNDNFFFEYKEGGFTQPNTNVNIKMLEWVLKNSEFKDDLCELYCGGGNFTIPFSKRFNRILATEISKTSINSAKRNCELNQIENIDFIRMSSEEFVEALNKVREFKRLKDISLDSYSFSTIFMDPPRAGLDDTTRTLAKDFEQIIYISCNPETLYRDLKELIKTHNVKSFALFDQFAYTNHIECGAVLTRKQPF